MPPHTRFSYGFDDDSYKADLRFDTHHLDTLDCADTWVEQAEIDARDAGGGGGGGGGGGAADDN